MFVFWVIHNFKFDWVKSLVGYYWSSQSILGSTKRPNRTESAKFADRDQSTHYQMDLKFWLIVVDRTFFRYFIKSWKGEGRNTHTHIYQQFYNMRFRDVCLQNSDFGLQFMNKWSYIEYIFIKMGVFSIWKIKKLVWKMVRYKLILEPWFERFGWALVEFQTRTKDLRMLQAFFERNECKRIK